MARIKELLAGDSHQGLSGGQLIHVRRCPSGWSNNKCHSGVLDGGAYVVETKVDSVYRTYMYGNPQFAKCDEAKQVLLIETIIADEFALKKAELRPANYRMASSPQQ